MTAKMEQSPKQSPAAVEPVADLIERLKDRRGNRALLCAEAAASLSLLSTKLENAERELDAQYDENVHRIASEGAALLERDELRAKLAEARAVHDVDQRAFLAAIARAENAEANLAEAREAAFEEAAQIAMAQITEPGLSDNPAYVRFEPSHVMARKIAAAIRARAVKGAGQS